MTGDDAQAQKLPDRSGDPSLIDSAELALALGTDLENGLSTDEAARRLAADGPNELRAVPPVPAWRRVLAQLQDPLVYLLGVAPLWTPATSPAPRSTPRRPK